MCIGIVFILEVCLKTLVCKLNKANDALYSVILVYEKMQTQLANKLFLNSTFHLPVLKIYKCVKVLL